MDWPYLVENGNGNITVVRSTDRSLWFDLVGSEYVGRFGAKSTFTHDADNQLFVLALPSGRRLEFHDFDQVSFPGGMFSRQIEPGGEVTSVTAYVDGVLIGEIQLSGTVGGNPLTEAFVYEYNDDDRLTSVLLRRQTGSLAWQNVQQALYEYYDGEEEHGSLGDLKLVRIQVPVDDQWEDSETSYYRYYTDDDLGHGFVHGLKYVIKPATFDRMIADSLDPLTVSDVLLAQSADNYFQYDAQQRVTLERVEGGSRTFTFAYINNSAAPAPNVWKTHTVEMFPAELWS